MKKIVSFLAFLLFIVKLFSQTSLLSKEYYFEKSEQQKTIGFVVLASGVGITALSLTAKELSLGVLVVALGGLGITIGSVAFFNASVRNKSKARAISAD